MKLGDVLFCTLHGAPGLDSATLRLFLSFCDHRHDMPSIADVDLLPMVKPQFEVGRERVGRGVVRAAADRREAIHLVAEAARGLGLPVRGFASSGLPGPKGNRETFVWCGGGPEVEDLEAAIFAVEGDG